MHRLIGAIAAFGMAVSIGALSGPSLAADAGNYSKMPKAAQTLRPGVELVGYRYCDYNGCYSCSYRECDDYDYRYGRKYCTHYTYSGCSHYGGGGGYGYGHKRHYYGGGGGGY